jgi:hypothetical protein
MLRRFGVIAVLAGLVALVVGGLASAALSHGMLWAILLRSALALAALGLMAKVVFRTTDIRPPEGIGRPIAITPSKREIWQAYTNCIDTYDAHTLGLVVKMMINLPHYLERINEDVALQDEVPELNILTHQIYRIGKKAPSTDQQPDHPHTLLVPVVLAEKGQLLDGFEILDSDGREVPTLSYNKTRGLLALAIQELIFKIAPSETTGITTEQAHDRRKQARNDSTLAVCAPGPRKKQPENRQIEINRLLDTIDDLPTTPDWKSRIKHFCETLADYYLVIAEVPVPDGAYVGIKYKQRVPLERSSQNILNRVRSRFGLRFSAIDIPLNLFALGVEAYHLQMDATPMQYVYDHHLEWLGDPNRKRLTQADLCVGEFKPYVRLHYDTAQPAMHLYIRRQLEPKSRAATTARSGFADRLKSVVELREIPPGALGATTVVSVVTAAIIGFFAITSIGEQTSGSQTVSSDIPALILALPGAASLIIGSWLDLSRLRQASLATYLGLAASVMLSLTSALYFLLDAYRHVPGRLVLFINSHVAMHTDIGWLVLAGLSATSALFLSRDLISTSRYYFQRVKKRVPAPRAGTE